MSKRYAWAGISGAIVLVLSGIGMAMPYGWDIRERVVVRSRPEHVLIHLETPKRWPDWTVWTAERYPELVSTFEGPPRGPGSRWLFSGGIGGEGKLIIERADIRDGILFRIEFTEHPPVFGEIRMATDEAQGTVQVEWEMEGVYAPGPISGWIGYFTGRRVQAEVAESLVRLKDRAEALAAEPI